MALQLGRLFRSAPASLLGIDIGVASIRIIELAPLGKDLRIERYAREPLSQGALRDGSIIEFGQVADGLRRALKKSGSRLRQAALAMPSGAVITKAFNLPDHLSEDEWEMQIEAEVGQSLPFSRDEISLDFGVIGPSRTAPGSIDFSLVAARKEKIDERLALAEAAGIKAMVMDVESYAALAAIARVIERERPDGSQPVALFQIGSETSSLSVLLQDTLLYEREQSFGSYKLEQDIARAAGNAGAVGGLVQAFHENAAHELARALQLFFASTSYDRIEHIYVAAGGFPVQGMPATLALRVAASVSLADPFSGMDISPVINQTMIAADAAACLVATGLAMRRVVA